MLEFFLGGGWSMFLVLVLGLAALVAAALFAARPDPARIGAIGALTRATVFASLAGVFSCFAAVGSKVPEHPEWAERMGGLGYVVLAGVGESMAPGILGFGLLSVVWLVMAAGHRRLARTAGIAPEGHPPPALGIDRG